jgi:hypothetical protein
MTTTVEAPFGYTEDELRSYLPTGWNLTGSAEGSWNPKKGRWAVRVEDGTDVRWDLVVDAREAEDKGRHEALRLGVDRLFRERLGRRTRGLGF